MHYSKFWTCQQHTLRFHFVLLSLYLLQFTLTPPLRLNSVSIKFSLKCWERQIIFYVSSFIITLPQTFCIGKWKIGMAATLTAIAVVLCYLIIDCRCCISVLLKYCQLDHRWLKLVSHDTPDPILSVKNYRCKAQHKQLFGLWPLPFKTHNEHGTTCYWIILTVCYQCT